MKRIIQIMTVSALLLFTGQGVYGISAVREDVPVTDIRIEPDTVRIPRNAMYQLTAVIEPENASDRTVIWSSSDPAVVSVDDSGCITAHTRGKAVIKARSSSADVCGECLVTVAMPADELDLQQDDVHIAKGETFQLTYVTEPESSDEIDAVWYSSDPSVVSVDQKGLIKGMSGGTAEITVEDIELKLKDTCTVTVEVPLKGIGFTMRSISLHKKDETGKLTVTYYPEDATNRNVVFVSDNENIASVDQDGIVTAHTSGTAYVTATAEDGGHTARIPVYVSIQAEGIALTPDALTLEKEQAPVQLTAQVLPEEAADQTVFWSSSDETVASVDDAGLVTPLSGGEAVITAETRDGGYTAQCSVTVIVPLKGIGFPMKSLTLHKKDETGKLTVSYFPEDATNRKVTFSCSDETVVTVDGNGIVTAHTGGTAYVTATAEDGGYTASIRVSVQIAAESVSIVPETAVLKPKETCQLHAEVLPQEAEERGVTWTSSDETVAAVDENGKVTAIADTGIGEAPTVIITVRTNDGGYTAECKVTVEDPVNAFVRRLYKLCFGRPADKSGFTNWTAKLRGKEITAAKAVQGFFNSKEMKGLELPGEEWIERCYLVMMDRAGDAGGKANWIDKYESGVSNNYILKGFVESREFSAICKEYDIEAGTIALTEARDQNIGITKFVSRCYSEVLGRKADVGGLNNWCNKILSASDQKKAAVSMASTGFFHSTEFRNRNTTNEEYVTILYRTFFGRDPDTGGYSNWLKKLKSGTSRDTVLSGFASSKEFANLLSSYGIR